MSFGPELISRFTAYKMKYQHSFSRSCQADSQIYVEDEKPEIVITPKKITYLGRVVCPISYEDFLPINNIKKIYQSY